ncbi:unnamed protein product [Caenorhabditis angaria]|uniref:Uncharacterized protein n=1 Tax=Caenorhabditis angaria TaxID=860376 RepID=A0A9P1IX45_9PELO|nr:unnamed protein product [Caenorhabditis angaria]
MKGWTLLAIFFIIFCTCQASVPCRSQSECRKGPRVLFNEEPKYPNSDLELLRKLQNQRDAELENEDILFPERPYGPNSKRYYTRF